MSLNVPENAWINCSTISGFSICLIILDIGQSFEHVSGIKYARILNIMQYSSYNNIIIVINVILEFLFA